MNRFLVFVLYRQQTFLKCKAKVWMLELVANLTSKNSSVYR